MIRLALNSQNTKLFSENVNQFVAGYREVGTTCPSTCPLLEKGCYAKGGNTAIHMRGRWSNHDGQVFFDTVTDKNKVKSGAFVRITVSGDIMLNDELDTEFLQNIIHAAIVRPDVTFYTYTHYKGTDLLRWLKIMPFNLNINISCDTTDDIVWAKQHNLPYVIVKDLGQNRVGEVVQCPNQTKGLTCDACKLCFKKDRKLQIAFKPHGMAAKSVKARTDSIELPMVKA
jgi:hypothetical protein